MAETTQKAEHEDGSSWHLPVQKQKKDASQALSPLELAASTDSFMDTAATAEISLSGHDLPGTPEQGPAIDDSFDSTNGALVRDDGTTLPRPDSASPDCDAVDGSIFGKAMREAERADDLLIPPLNFGRVCRGVYRSGFPGKKNFTFLKKLKLHTVLNLSEHEYSKESIEFLSDNQIEWTHMPILGNREPMQSTDEALLCKALLQVLRATADRPLLIHCTKGTHRTGCVVGCLRKLEEWSLTSIFDEYQRYAGSKAPHLDQQFIEFFAPTEEHREMARKREPFDA